MKLLVINHNFHYEMEKLVRIFFPNEKIEVVRDENTEDFQLLTSVGENITVAARFNPHSPSLR